MTIGVECAVGVIVQAACTYAIAVVLILTHLADLIALVIDNLLDKLPLVVILILGTPGEVTTKVAILSLGNELSELIVGLGMVHPLVLTIGRSLPLLDREGLTLALGKLATLGLLGMGRKGA